jgi:hypothetical protein
MNKKRKLQIAVGPQATPSQERMQQLGSLLELKALPKIAVSSFEIPYIQAYP